MVQTVNVFEKGQPALKTLFGLGAYLAKSPVEKPLLELIYFRVSQINHCAYCLDMHSKDLRAGGESEQRLYVLDAWREAPFYTDRERAALAWAETLTKPAGGHIPEEIYADARAQFTEEELIDLSFATIAINSWNRVNIAFPSGQVGSYRPGQHAL